MGHYASEMMCDTCGKLRCVCPRPETKPPKGWIVNLDFTVSTVAEFDKANSSIKGRYGSIPLNPLMMRMGKTIYKTRRGAEKAALKACEDAVENTRKDLLRLKNVLKVVRPWELK